MHKLDSFSRNQTSIDMINIHDYTSLYPIIQCSTGWLNAVDISIIQNSSAV